MRTRQVIGIAMVCAASVVAADLLMHSSLLHLLQPRILEPADGAIVSGPVTVHWEGPRPMQATLTGNGQRIELGDRDSPFEIDPSRFSRPGQYGIELRSAFGGLIGADRRFMVRRPSRAAAVATLSDAGATPATAPPRVAPAPTGLQELLAERDRLRVDLAATQNELALLRQDQDSSADAHDTAQAESDALLANTEAARLALAGEHLAALQENQALRQRLERIPACTVWGYLAAPRPQTSPPSRHILVSNRRGDVFRNEPQCVATRRTDPAGLSPCVCVGALY